MATGGDGEGLGPARSDQARYDEVFRRRRVGMVQYAQRLLDSRCPQDAEDAVQEAFKRAWAKRRRRPPHVELEHWLLRFVLNCARETRRRGGRSVVVRPEDLTELSPEHDGEIGRVDERQELLPLWDALTQEERQVLLLRSEGFDYAAIARVLGVREATARKRSERARRHFRELAEGYLGPRPADDNGSRMNGSGPTAPGRGER